MKEVMEKYSTTFFDCMKAWPDEIKEDIYKLYAYLRVCDEVVEGDPDAWVGGARGGGYLSSSGILAPYHKKLIDGLYAGGRINY